MRRTFTYVVEQDPDTGLYVGYVPGLPGAHSQGETLDELRTGMVEVLALLHESGELEAVSAFVGTQQVEVAL